MSKRKAPHSRLFEEVIVKSWWVILFFLFSYFIFDQAMKKKDKTEGALQEKLDYLQGEIALAESRQEDLKIEIASAKDPAWVEITLKRCLGLVSEGDQKVHFKKKSE